ncbi:hypothetical protein VTI28DRAFT_7679 [Corynascus sepedonium]
MRARLRFRRVVVLLLALAIAELAPVGRVERQVTAQARVRLAGELAPQHVDGVGPEAGAHPDVGHGGAAQAALGVRLAAEGLDVGLFQLQALDPEGVEEQQLRQRRDRGAGVVEKPPVAVAEQLSVQAGRGKIQVERGSVVVVELLAVGAGTEFRDGKLLAYGAQRVPGGGISVLGLGLRDEGQNVEKLWERAMGNSQGVLAYSSSAGPGAHASTMFHAIGLQRRLQRASV